MRTLTDARQASIVGLAVAIARGNCQAVEPRVRFLFWGVAIQVNRATATAAKSGKKAPAKQSDNERVVCENRKAKHKYLVLDALECGIALQGSEVKSIRGGKVSLDESYAWLKGGEVWLLGCDIAEYAQASRFNHVPRRPRKLLLHRREIKRFAARATEKGLTLIPLRLYFKAGRAKVLIGLCRGKQQHDKREAMKNVEAQRAIQRAMRRR